MSEQAEYRWRAGCSYPVPAEIASGELRRIEAEEGLTAGAVVDASRPKDAPLHPCFEWHDRTAAEKYRLAQARNLIRAVVVTERDREPVQEFVLCGIVQETSFGPDNEPKRQTQYVSIETAINNPDLFRDAVGRLQSQLRGIASNVAAIVSMAAEQEDSDERVKAAKLVLTSIRRAESCVQQLKG